MRTLLTLACLCFSSATIEVRADDKSPCQVYVILFVPADVDPPNDYQARVDQIVDYSEAFFQREFRRWEHEKIVMPFRRSAGSRGSDDDAREEEDDGLQAGWRPHGSHGCQQT